MLRGVSACTPSEARCWDDVLLPLQEHQETNQCAGGAATRHQAQARGKGLVATHFVPRGTCGIEKHPRVEGNHTNNAPAPRTLHRRSHQLHPPARFRHYTQTMASNSAKVAPGADEGPYAYVKGEGFTTMMLHHGHKVDTDNRARAPPIFQSTSFEFKDAAHGGALFELSQLGPIYTRLMNPTTHVLEYKIAKLEGAPCKAHGNFDNAATLCVVLVHHISLYRPSHPRPPPLPRPNALAVASGQSAQMHALMTIMGHGDNFIAASELYVTAPLLRLQVLLLRPRARRAGGAGGCAYY